MTYNIFSVSAFLYERTRLTLPSLSASSFVNREANRPIRTPPIPHPTPNTSAGKQQQINPANNTWTFCLPFTAKECQHIYPIAITLSHRCLLPRGMKDEIREPAGTLPILVFWGLNYYIALSHLWMKNAFKKIGMTVEPISLERVRKKRCIVIIIYNQKFGWV